MKRVISFVLPGILMIGVAGCAKFGNEARAGAVVVVAGEKPEEPVLTAPTPSPGPNAHNGEVVSPVSSAPGEKDTIIEIGDTLEVSVEEDASFNGNYEVRRGGYFILPAVGRIEAASLSLKEIEVRVRKSLEETQMAHATVRVSKLGGSDSGRRR